KEIYVRRAKAEEKIVTLDEEERTLSPENIVITNGEKPIALAGVMGGLDSHITDETVTVALEAALFDPISIRKTAKALNLRSESSARFEKGINLATVQEAGKQAAAWMAELAGGRIVSGIAEARSVEAKDVTVSITLEKINHALGTELSEDEVTSIFDQLGFDASISNGT